MKLLVRKVRIIPAQAARSDNPMIGGKVYQFSVEIVSLRVFINGKEDMLCRGY